MSWSEVKKINGDMKKSLDTLIKEQFSDKITPIDSKLTTTQTKVNSIDTKVNSLEIKVNNLGSDLTSLTNRGGIKSIQRGTRNSRFSSNVTISYVDTSKAMLLINYNDDTNSSSSSNSAPISVTGRIVSSTSIRIDIDGGYGTPTIDWQVIEFY